MLFDDSYERYWNRDDVCKNTTNLTGHSKYQIFEVQNCTIAYTLKILRNHLMTVQKESCPFQLITFVKFEHIYTYQLYTQLQNLRTFLKFCPPKLDSARVRYPPTSKSYCTKWPHNLSMALGLDFSCLNLLLDL